MSDKENYKWDQNCWYLVDVAYDRFNIIHRSLFYSGFLHDDKPGNYNMFANASYENEALSFKDAYYLKVIRKVVDDKELHIQIELSGDRDD